MEKVCKNCNKTFYPVICVKGVRKWLRYRSCCFICIPYHPGRGMGRKHLEIPFKETKTCRICKLEKDLSEFSLMINLVEDVRIAIFVMLKEVENQNIDLKKSV